MDEIDDLNLIEKYNKTDDTTPSSPTIIAMGVGGGGSNAVSYMCANGVKGVDFVVLNTDRQALYHSPVMNRILLGPKITQGLGAGGNPEVGEEAAKESIPEIDKLLNPNVKMVFITAGMGGGTGTGGAPVVAGVAKSKGILTVGIVTIPFFFEGMDKLHSALDGAARLQENVDALLMINNDRLGLMYPDMEWSEAFTKADDVLAVAARTISDMVTSLANINIDMNDVDSCLRGGRTAMISVGYGEGKNRMSSAISSALHSPLLCDTDISSARRLLFAFYYSKEIDPPFAVSEAMEANKLVAQVNSKVKIKFGWGYDESLGNKIKFTLLAAGFDMSVETSEGPKPFGGAESEDGGDNIVDQGVIAAYGKEKIEAFLRSQETHNYYILTPEQLDSDQAIEMVERDPTYKRDKRKSAANRRAEMTQSDTHSSTGSTFTLGNDINISLDDR